MFTSCILDRIPSIPYTSGIRVLCEEFLVGKRKRQRVKGKAKAPAFQRHLHTSPQHLMPSTRAHTWHWTLTQALLVSYLIRINTNQEVRRLHHGCTTWGCLPRETWQIKRSMVRESWRECLNWRTWMKKIQYDFIKLIIKYAFVSRIHGWTWIRCLLGPWQRSFLRSPECGDCSSCREGIKKRATFFRHFATEAPHSHTNFILMPCHAVWSESGPPWFHCYICVTGLQMNVCVCAFFLKTLVVTVTDKTWYNVCNSSRRVALFPV